MKALPTTAFVCILGLLTPNLSFAQQVSEKDKAAARQLATEGSHRYRAGEFQTAYDRFDRAYRLVGAPNVGIWAARSLVKLGQLVLAAERYRQVASAELPEDAPPSHAQAVHDAAAERKALMARIPNLTLTVEGRPPEEVFVTMDGEQVDLALLGVKQPVDPGTHEITATAGDEVLNENVTLAERGSKTVTLRFAAEAGTLEPAPAASASTTAIAADAGTGSSRATVGLVTLGAGGLLLLGGGATGLVALGQKSDLDTNCPNSQCGPGFHADVDSYESMKLYSSIGLIGGAVLAGAGLTLWLSAPTATDSGETARLGAWTNGEQLGLRGRW